MKHVTTKNNIIHNLYRFSMFLIGTYIVALTYNTFLLPNSLVVGGTTGLSIIFEKLFGWNAGLFILFTGIFLLAISFIFLGYKITKHNIIGTFLYPIMIMLSAPVAELLIPYIKLDDFIVVVVLAGALYGFGFGIIYKTGFSTGGFDVVMQLLNKYLKMPEGDASLAANLLVVLCGLPIIGVRLVTYSAITLIVETVVTNKINIGISNSKVFFVYTRKIDQVRDALVKNGTIGFTVIPTLGGYSHYKGEMLMCVVSTRDYYAFREVVLNIDKNAFFVINDCYEVNGGYKRQHLPFL